MKDYRRRRNYLIEYRCFDRNGLVIKTGKIKAKNKASEFEALAGTEDYLKRKIPGMVKMGCVSIKEDYFLGEMFSQFEDLFGGRKK